MVTPTSRQSFMIYRPRPGEPLAEKIDRLRRELRILRAEERGIGLFIEATAPDDETVSLDIGP